MFNFKVNKYLNKFHVFNVWKTCRNGRFFFLFFFSPVCRWRLIHGRNKNQKFTTLTLCFYEISPYIAHFKFHLSYVSFLFMCLIWSQSTRKLFNGITLHLRQERKKIENYNFLYIRRCLIAMCVVCSTYYRIAKNKNKKK